jgi:hypothetical protein
VVQDLDFFAERGGDVAFLLRSLPAGLVELGCGRMRRHQASRRPSSRVARDFVVEPEALSLGVKEHGLEKRSAVEVERVGSKPGELFTREWRSQHREPCDQRPQPVALWSERLEEEADSLPNRRRKNRAFRLSFREHQRHPQSQLQRRESPERAFEQLWLDSAQAGGSVLERSPVSGVEDRRVGPARQRDGIDPRAPVRGGHDRLEVRDGEERFGEGLHASAERQRRRTVVLSGEWLVEKHDQLGGVPLDLAPEHLELRGPGRCLRSIAKHLAEPVRALIPARVDAHRRRRRSSGQSRAPGAFHRAPVLGARAPMSSPRPAAR